jgi:hypothetical protein
MGWKATPSAGSAGTGPEGGRSAGGSRRSEHLVEGYRLEIAVVDD